MNTQVVAILVNMGTKIIADVFQHAGSRTQELPSKAESMRILLEEDDARREVKSEELENKRAAAAEAKAVAEIQAQAIAAEEPPDEEPSPQTEKATAPATGCISCALGHLGTCSGLLNEGMRFARADGLASEEVIERISMCQDELNTMERVDMRPEMIVDLVPWEKTLAEKALEESRNIRHKIQGLRTVDDLERLAANTQTKRMEIGRDYFRQTLGHMSAEDQEVIKQRVMDSIEELVHGKDGVEAADE